MTKKNFLEEPNIESIVKYIIKNNVKNIIVMTGAGISTAAGIPDFRSKSTGLYYNFQRLGLPYARAVNPKPFYKLSKILYPGQFLPTKTHYFIKLLKEKGLLLRNFTQNIDTLDRMTGLEHSYTVEAHGGFTTASCIECKQPVNEKIIRRSLPDNMPRCEFCKGLVKSDVTFFGEPYPQRFFEYWTDFKKADLLIVMGTSLQVYPFATLIDVVGDDVPRLLINNELVGCYNSKETGFDFNWEYGLSRDASYVGSCDEAVEKMATLLGWGEDLERMYTKGCSNLRALWKQDNKHKDRNETTLKVSANGADLLTDRLDQMSISDKNK
ncbi:DHS-like NAD/FAD-binding domain-containing protein [Sporodiniella umbellata]|nr:DHS-like NAD/FAD-binding domain-containing protein [Sporodiniella umbellata]